jgi:hypothetical protein
VNAPLTPLWRWSVAGALFGFAAVYFLYTGEIAVDKKHTMLIRRGADPLLYWSIVLVFAALGGAGLYKAWQHLRST